MMSHDNQGQSLDEMQEQLQFTGEEVDCDTHAIFSPSEAPVNECSSPYAESMPRSEINKDSLYMDTYDGDSDLTQPDFVFLHIRFARSYA